MTVVGGRPLAATRPAPATYADAGVWPNATLGSHLDGAATDAPSALAVVDGSTRLDYGELRARVESAAAALTAAGVGRGDVVTVVLPNWWEALVAMHAVLRLGAVVNPVVPIYRDREVGFIVTQARPRVVVVPHRFRGFDYVEMMQRVREGSAEPPAVVVVRPEGPLPPGFSSFDELERFPTTADDAARSDDICLLLYTSGTTADPKGVLHNHRTLGYEIGSIVELFGLGAGDTVFMPSPVTHITGFLFAVVLPPILRVPVVLLDVWDPAVAVGLIEQESCRFSVGATPFLQGLTDSYSSPSSLRAFLCGGADVPPELVRRARAVLGATVVRVYGSSEFPTYSCGGPTDDLAIAAETDGLPIGPVECRLDDVDGAAVGELLLRGPDLFLGYLDASLNDAAFTADGYFRTGDLASVRPDGAVTIMGRKKDVIIRNGENISAKELEDLLYEHPAVREVAVVAVPDPTVGERACAFIVPADGAAPTLDELCRFLDEQRIARQKLPERMIVLDELPKTASGKVQKFLLRDRARQEA